ncbi:MAG: glycosyltransferase [Gemmatimonadaceae bacterium]|nr:glycosyltransferase [Gemmatimonadaceae bacterium]
MSERFDILHLVAPGAVGGIESVIRLLAAGQRRRGHRVRVLATLESRDGAAPFLAALRDANVDVIPLVARSRAYLREWRTVARVCREDPPDVVHTHGYRSDVVGSAAARRGGVPTVSTVHGFTGGDWKNRLYERLQRAMYRRFDAVVPVSAPMAASLARSRLRRDRLHLVPNAYEPTQPLPRAVARRRLGIVDGAFRVGWIGRATHEKGLDIAVRAIAHPSAMGSVLSVIGDGAERDRAMQLASSLGVADRISWHGLVPDAGPLVTAFDALLLSSRTEGTPIVLFEAMAACTPIIATHVGGVPDVVGYGEAALVPPEDPGAIAGVVQTMRLDGSESARRAAAARARLEREFALEPWLDRYEGVYRSAIAARRAAA